MALSKEEKENRKEKRRVEKYNKTHRIDENGEIEKMCTICNQWFLATEENFYKNNQATENTLDKLHPYCKECEIKKNRKWAVDNPERKKISGRKYVPKKENQRRVSQKRRDTGKYQKWLKDNPDKLKEYGLKRMNKNHKINKREWKACKSYFNNCCAYCGLPIEQHKKKYNGILKNMDLHKEHVNHEGANDLSNCVPACNFCNSSKKTHDMEKWYREQSFFSEEKLIKIYKWLNEDYKLYIEEHKTTKKNKN